jgi:hypothetical protein
MARFAAILPLITAITSRDDPPFGASPDIDLSLEAPEQSLERIWATLENSGLTFDRSALSHA